MNTNQVDISDNTVLYTIQLPSKLENILNVENFVESLRLQYDISEEVYANILTCLSEATINAVVHGNQENPEKKVYINLEVINSRRFIFTIADEGEGFDYNKLPDPTAPENLENLTGRGVFIIKKLADQCIFNQKGNEVELHFRL